MKSIMKHNEKATDWGAIYNQQLKKRARARYEYDVVQDHGVGAYDRLQKQKLNELHQFFVKFEQKNCSKKLSVKFIS